MKKILFVICLFTKVSSQLNAQVTTATNGNVGIGTTTPNSKLHVYSTVAGDDVTIENTATNGQSSIWVKPGGGYQWALGATGGSHATFPNSFYVYNTVGNPGLKFLINGAGNVGIGTTNPKSQLQLGNFSRIGTEFNNTYLSRGWYYEGGANKTNDPSPSLIGVQNDGIAFFADANIPINTAYTPTARMFVANDGNIRIMASASRRSGITLGNASDTGSLNTLVGASPGAYNIDFRGYRDIAPDQIGARIRGERINVYRPNEPLMQRMDLAFSTSPGGDASQLAERMRIYGNGDVVVGSAFPPSKLGVGIAPTSALHIATGGKAGDDAYIQIQRRDANAATMGLALLPSGACTAANLAYGYGVWSNTNDLRIWTYDGVDNTIRFVVRGENGNVGIGTPLPMEKLSVNGTVLAKKVRVSEKAVDWPDYVFSKNYKLRPLSSLEAFINEQHHLPDVPSAEKIEKNGLDLGSTQAVLLRKIEELTLYMLEQSKKMKTLEEEIASLKLSQK